MRVKLGLMLLLIAGLLTTPSMAQDMTKKAVTLYWEDLLPANEEYVLKKLDPSQKAEDTAARSATSDIPGDFPVIEALDGYRVRIPGFVVPLEFSRDGKLSNFLLVPYQGACIHEPPPPPNQVVHAKTDNPQEFPNIWTPIWLTGTLSTEEYLNFLGDAAYTLQIESWEIYRGRE